MIRFSRNHDQDGLANLRRVFCLVVLMEKVYVSLAYLFRVFALAAQ